MALFKSEYKDEIKLLAPRNQTNNLIVHDFKSGNFQVSGDYPVLDQIQKKKLISGRFINQNDILSYAKVTVIAEDMYKQLFDKGEEAIGVYIKINGINYKRGKVKRIFAVFLALNFIQSGLRHSKTSQGGSLKRFKLSQVKAIPETAKNKSNFHWIV